MTQRRHHDRHDDRQVNDHQHDGDPREVEMDHEVGHDRQDGHAHQDREEEPATLSTTANRPTDEWTWTRYLGRVLSSLLILPVRAYQRFISPLFGPTCRFDPTCSEYFIQAVKKYGPVRGAWRGVCRIARCHPFHPGGHDPP